MAFDFILLTLVFVQSMMILLILKIVLYIREFAAPTEPGLPRPQKPTILSITGGTMDKYIYKISLPALGANDVVKREMYVMINGGEATVYEMDATVAEWDLILEENSECKIWMVDIDDADNRSPDGVALEFVVVDIIPPAAPQAPTVASVEVFEEPVVEEPVVEEPVVEEPVVEEPVVEEPVVEEPVVEEPVVEEPVVEEPVVEEPVVEEPVEGDETT